MSVKIIGDRKGSKDCWIKVANILTEYALYYLCFALTFVLTKVGWIKFFC